MSATKRRGVCSPTPTPRDWLVAPQMTLERLPVVLSDHISSMLLVHEWHNLREVSMRMNEVTGRPQSMTRTVTLDMKWHHHAYKRVKHKTAKSDGTPYQLKNLIKRGPHECMAGGGCTGVRENPCTTMWPYPARYFTAITDLTLILTICDCKNSYSNTPMPAWLAERCSLLRAATKLTAFKLVIKFAHKRRCQTDGTQLLEEQLLAMASQRLRSLDLLGTHSDWDVYTSFPCTPCRSFPTTLEKLATHIGFERSHGDLSRYASLTYLHIYKAQTYEGTSNLHKLPNLSTLRLGPTFDDDFSIDGLTSLTALDMSVDPDDDEAANQDEVRTDLPDMMMRKPPPLLRSADVSGWEVQSSEEKGWCKMHPTWRTQLTSFSHLSNTPTGCLPLLDDEPCLHSCCKPEGGPEDEDDDDGDGPGFYNRDLLEEI